MMPFSEGAFIVCSIYVCALESKVEATNTLALYKERKILNVSGGRVIE